MTRRRPKRPAPAVRPPFPAAGVELLGTMSDRVLAAQLGVPWAAVTEERKRRRIPPARSGPRAKGDAKRSERIQVMVTVEVAARVDAARGDLSRSDWGAGAIERALEAAPPAGSQS